MNQRENLILHNGQDITADVRFCQYNPTYKMYDITFQSDKIYQLQKQYNGLDFVGSDSAMALYLNPKDYKLHTYPANGF